MGNGANQLSAADFDALKVKYDKNKDQTLSFDETLALVEEIRVREGAPNPVPEAKVKALFGKIDSNGNGSIGFDEFKGVYFVYQSERARVKAASKAKIPSKAPPGKKAPPPKSTPAAAKPGVAKAPPGAAGTASSVAAKGKGKAKPKAKPPPPVKRPPPAKASGKGTAAAAGNPKAKAGAAAGTAQQLSPDAAATKLQANFRGAQVRKDLAAKGKGKGKGKGTGKGKTSGKGPTTKGSAKGTGKATPAAAAPKPKTPTATPAKATTAAAVEEEAATAKAEVAAKPGSMETAADTAMAAAGAGGMAASNIVAKPQGKAGTFKSSAAAVASASSFGKAKPKVPAKAAPKPAAEQEQQVSKAVTKAQIAILHRIKRLTRAWCRTAKRLAEQRLAEQEAPEAPWASDEPWAARLATSTRLAGGNAALQSGRRPGLQGLEGEVGDQSLSAVRKTQDELDNVGRHDAEEGDFEVESEGSGESAESISGHVSRTWKPNNSSVSRYRNPRDRAVGLRQAPPLVWSAQEWERRLGSTTSTSGGGAPSSGNLAAQSETIRPRQDMLVGSGNDQDQGRGFDGINSFAGMGTFETQTQTKGFTSKLFESEERKVLERMMADDRARRRKLALEEEEARRARADAQMAASDVVSRVHAGLAAVPSLAPVLPVRTQAAELFEARELLQGLQSAAAANAAAAAAEAANRERQGLRGGAVLPAEMFMVGRSLQASSSQLGPGAVTRRGGDMEARSYGAGPYPKSVPQVLSQHGVNQEKVWL